MAGALLARAARAAGRGLRAKHLSVLDGQTLNLAAVLPRNPPGTSIAVEFTSGPHQTNAPIRTARSVDGDHTLVVATVRLRVGDTHGTPEPTGHVPEVVLTPGVWGLQLHFDIGQDGRRVPLAAPPAAVGGGHAPASPATASHTTAFLLTGTLSGTAALAVLPQQPTAWVHTVDIRPDRARVGGELVGAGPHETITAELARCRQEVAHEVCPAFSAGTRGPLFRVTLPLPAMAATTASSGTDTSEWWLRFRAADGALLAARRTRPGETATPMEPPARTVRPDDGPPVLLRSYYTCSASLVVSLTVLPAQA